MEKLTLLSVTAYDINMA